LDLRLVVWVDASSLLILDFKAGRLVTDWISCVTEGYVYELSTTQLAVQNVVLCFLLGVV